MVEINTKLDGYKTYLLGIAALVLVCIAHTTGDDATQWMDLARDGSIPAMLMALRHGTKKA